jgi:hypothetical protein
LKQYQIILAKNSARELRMRENKSQAINTRDTGDLFYRGSALEGLVPVEESTKDGSLSTLQNFGGSSMGVKTPRTNEHKM